jgi:hypothetical protein
MNISKNNINTGKLLADYIRKNRIIKSELGKEIHRDGVAIWRFTQNQSIQTGILIEICHAFKHNFFQDISNRLPPDFTVNTEIAGSDKNLIAQLQEENKVLKIQVDILIKASRG